MAQRYPNRTTMNLSESTWKTTDDLPEGTAVKPASADDVDLTVNSGVVTQDEDCPVTGSLSSFEMGGGTWVDAAFDVFVSGNMLISGGTLTSTGKWTMTGNGNLRCEDGGNIIKELVVDSGNTATLANVVRAASVDFCGATVAMGANHLYISATANNPVLVDASTIITASTGLFEIQHNTLGGTLQQSAMIFGSFGGNLYFTMANGTIVQMTGDLDIGAGPVTVRGNGIGNNGTLDMNGNDLTCGGITLGRAAGSGSGILLCGEGIISAASVTMNHDDNDGNILAFDTCNWTSSGIIDGNNQDTNPMTVTSTGANLHGGSLLDVTCTGPLHCWGVTDSGNNSVDVMHEGSNVGAALGGMQSAIGIAA